MFGPTGTEQLILSSYIVSVVAMDESSNDHEDVNFFVDFLLFFRFIQISVSLGNLRLAVGNNC